MLQQTIFFKNFSTSHKHRIVLLRHGQSVWNKQKRYSGWTDIRLSQIGIEEAKRSGRVLKYHGFKFNLCYTSVLTRAIQTFNFMAQQANFLHIPLIKSWKLNQRQYGALQGLNKLDTVEKYGKQQVKLWRRAYDAPPPPLTDDDPRHPKYDRKYKHINPNELPLRESLKDTVERVWPYWQNQVIESVKKGKDVIVVAHQNTIRAIVKNLNNFNQQEIAQLEIPTAIPLVYQFDEKMNLTKQYYLGQREQIQSRIQSSRMQTQKC